jgi:membrane associated rhomboid family serine protease
VTWSLIAANVAVHLLLWPLAWQSASPDDPALYDYLQVVAREHGVRPQSVSRAELLRFEHGVRPQSFSLGDAFTSMFLHAGLAHLFGNMLFLWIFGDNVEHRLGRWAFLLAYLGTGVAATLGDTVLRWGSGIPSVGASGAISGVLGLYFAWFPHNRVRVFVFLFPFFMDFIELRARWVLGFYLGLRRSTRPRRGRCCTSSSGRCGACPAAVPGDRVEIRERVSPDRPVCGILRPPWRPSAAPGSSSTPPPC